MRVCSPRYCSFPRPDCEMPHLLFLSTERLLCEEQGEDQLPINCPLHQALSNVINGNS